MSARSGSRCVPTRASISRANTRSGASCCRRVWRTRSMTRRRRSTATGHVGARCSSAGASQLGAERIVSLLPSATEIVCALGLEERLVGISHSCDYPDSITDRPRLSRPRANLEGLSSGEIDAAIRAAMRDHGSVYEIDVAGIRELQPDLVLTQGICDVCAVPQSQVTAASLGASIVTLDAHDLAAIFASIRDVGCATGTVEQAEDCVADMQRRIEAVRARTAGRPRPRVVALEWLDPPYVPGHWVPELIGLAGGHLLAGTSRRPSYRVEWTDVRTLDADVVLVMLC